MIVMVTVTVTDEPAAEGFTGVNAVSLDDGKTMYRCERDADEVEEWVEVSQDTPQSIHRLASRFVLVLVAVCMLA